LCSLESYETKGRRNFAEAQASVIWKRILWESVEGTPTENLGSGDGYKIEYTDVAEKADAWLKWQMSLYISIVYAGRGGGIRRLAPETRHITPLMRLAL